MTDIIGAWTLANFMGPGDTENKGNRHGRITILGNNEVKIVHGVGSGV